MKFKTSALAMTATVAVGLMSSAFAAETSYDKLGFSTNQTYSADASGPSNGSWNKTPVVTDSKIEIDSDSTDRFTFTPATVNSGVNSGENTVVNATELKFNVEASVVPNSVTLTNDTSAQCGFAIKETIEENVVSTNFHVFTGSAWQKISNDVEIPAAGTMFDLTVKLDYRSGFCKARYLVNESDIGKGTWYSIKSGSQKVSCIDFIGNGKLTSLNGYVLQIVSEIIQINPGSAGQYEVTFSETQIADLKAKLGVEASKIGTALSDTDPLPNGQTKFNNYVLYGDVVGAEAEKPVVKADPSATPSAVNNVVVKVPLFDNVQTVGGVDVTHVLKGSANGADGWTQVGNAEKGNEPQFEIPANSPYRYFKVETTVSPTGK